MNRLRKISVSGWLLITLLLLLTGSMTVIADSVSDNKVTVFHDPG
jgi:hypothetical protein